MAAQHVTRIEAGDGHDILFCTRKLAFPDADTGGESGERQQQRGDQQAAIHGALLRKVWNIRRQPSASPISSTPAKIRPAPVMASDPKSSK